MIIKRMRWRDAMHKKREVKQNMIVFSLVIFRCITVKAKSK